jgi:phosphate uptake regulator
MLGRAEAAWATLDLDLSSEIVAGATAARVQQTEFMAALIGLGRVPMDAAVAVAMAARAFERLADHAVEIAERVHFAVDGTPAPLLRP